MRPLRVILLHFKKKRKERRINDEYFSGDEDEDIFNRARKTGCSGHSIKLTYVFFYCFF